MLKEGGVDGVCHPLEVWDPRLFSLICPGKAKNIGQSEWIKRLTTGVEGLGKGTVTTAFVDGVELAHPAGYKSEDEAAESYLEGCRWLNEHGIYANGLFFRPVPGTMFEGVVPPRTEYFLRTSLARYKLSRANDIVLKADRPFKDTRPGLGHDLAKFGLRQTLAGRAGEGDRQA